MALGLLRPPVGAVLGALVFFAREPRTQGDHMLSHLEWAASASQPDTSLAAACRRVWSLRPDGTDLEGWPAAFPEPPARARRCTARANTRTVYYVWDVPNQEILTYWEAALRQTGYRTQRVGGRIPGRDFLRFAGPAAGKISLSPRGGGFVIVLGGAV